MRAPRALPSPVEGVSLWRVELVFGKIELEKLASHLGPDEHLRAARFGSPQLRDRWIAGRGSLRMILGDTLGVAPTSVAIARGRRGRPQLGPAHPRIDFNLSHTGEVALVAIGNGLDANERIGVDIELVDRDVNADRLARKFLTARERNDDARLDPDSRRRTFLRRWTCKEAMSKATGDALLAPFRAIDIDCRDGIALRDGPPPYVPGDWTLHAIDASAGMLAALAIWRMP
jgi:4'-phosphopantetheinyl transferase